MSADVLGIAVRAARMAAAGDPEFPFYLADRVGAAVGVDSGVGYVEMSLASPRAPTSVVVAPALQLSTGQITAAEGALAEHPVLRDPQWHIRTPCVRVSDRVALPAFWDTETWRCVHGPGQGRYPAAVALGRHGHTLVFLGLHRVAKDFSDAEMTALEVIREPVTAALAYRYALEVAAATIRAQTAPPAPRPVLRQLDSGYDLSLREAQIVGLVAQGFTTGHIGRALGITERTVQKHITAACLKLGVESRAAAAATLARMGRRP